MCPSHGSPRVERQFAMLLVHADGRTGLELAAEFSLDLQENHLNLGLTLWRDLQGVEIEK